MQGKGDMLIYLLFVFFIEKKKMMCIVSVLFTCIFNCDNILEENK